MEKITIVSLIYQSCEYAKSLYSNLLKFTPELENGEAEFYFIANDATDDVLNFLKDNNYPHYINNNKHYTEDELFKMGFAYPEYINRVYAGYNYGIKISTNPIIVLLNSDVFFSTDWLKNLKSKLTYNNVVSPFMIQPSPFRNPINNHMCLIYDCGSTLSTFDENKFLNKVDELKKDIISVGICFMPMMIYKSNIEKIGYYPEGNIHDGNYNIIDIQVIHIFI